MANLRTDNLYGVSGPDSNGSALFNGTDYLTAANVSAFRVNQGSTEDFTIEAWIYLKEAPSGNARIASIYHTSGNQRSYMLYVSSDLQLKFNYASSGTAGSVSTLNAGTVPTNEWVHVAVAHEVSSTTLRLFKNGLHAVTDNAPHATYYANTSGVFATGQDFPAESFISNLHITRGTCKYTGNFTPSKEPIEEDSNTTVLCLNSRLNVLNDDKSNTFTQTAADGVKASPLMPFSRADDGITFNGAINMNSQSYMYFPTGRTEDRGRGFVVFAGGINPSLTSSMEYVHIPSGGNTIKFGDLTTARNEQMAVSSATRGIWGGGTTGSYINTMEFVTLSTSSNTTDFGDLTVARGHGGGVQNSTRGVFMIGYTPTSLNVMDYVTMATQGDATDFGDAIVAGWPCGGGRSSSTRGVLMGMGNSGNTIQYITIMTTGNSQDFGDLNTSSYGVGAGEVSDGLRGVAMGGSGAPADATNVIDFITIATTGNATDFGDLTQARRGGGVGCTLTRGILGGGRTPSDVNTIDSIIIQTTGNATDFGDLIGVIAFNHPGCSDSHGGLT